MWPQEDVGGGCQSHISQPFIGIPLHSQVSLLVQGILQEKMTTDWVIDISYDKKNVGESKKADLEHNQESSDDPLVVVIPAVLLEWQGRDQQAWNYK